MKKMPLYDPSTGIHRAKVWEIAFYALNNTSTNMTFVIFGAITYFLTGIVGLTTIVAGTIITSMRIWDGITDPLIGYIVDKTNGKFGKNRPFILLGNLIQFAGAGLIFVLIPNMPETFRPIAYVLFYMFYIIGYTFQTVVTKSAQSCLTNDPKQRPVFTIFDTVFALVIFAFLPLYNVNVLMTKYGGATSALQTPAYFVELWFIFSLVSFGMAVLAIIGLWRKDRVEFYGTGKVVKITFKDYWDVIRNNRAIQMLIVAASSDKLCLKFQSHAVISMMIYGIIVGNFKQSAQVGAVLAIPQMVLSILVIYFVATKMGQRKALLVGTYGAIIGAFGLLFLFLFGTPSDLDLTFSNGLTFFTAAFAVLMLGMNTMKAMSQGIVIPMTADCADYEVYRSGKYVPGLMGTLFSSIDKFVSSLSETILAVLLASIGFAETLPNENTPLTPTILYMTMFCFVGIPTIGWIANIIAMKFYPLTKEKMAEIQVEIARIKKEGMASKNVGVDL